MNEGYKITWISLITNLLLGILKVAAGVVSGSSALVADGAHSLTDLSTDLAVILGLTIGAKPEDEKHPYGHHRFSSLIQMFIGFLLAGGSIALVIDSARRLEDQEFSELNAWVIAIAALSLLIKELLYYKTKFIAQKLKSELILANAIHHRADGLSSLLVLVALVSIYFGGANWAFMDKAVGIGLGLFLLIEGGKIIYSSCNNLIDTAPEKSIVEDFREHILETPGVLAYHHFRARKVGDMFAVDFHIQVDPKLKVDEGHKISSDVKQHVLDEHPEVLEVLVHLEPATREHMLGKGLSDRI